MTYEELVGIFWQEHEPTLQPWSGQYRNILFYHSPQQKLTAELSKSKIASETKDTILTEILPFSGFHIAEGYHQKFRLRNDPLLIDEFEAIYPASEGLISSTAAARVNGYLGGNGTCDSLKAEIDSLGLSEKGQRRLLNEVCEGGKGSACFGGRCL